MLLRNQLLVRAIDAVTHQWRQRIVGLHVILLDDRLLMKVILQARRSWTFSVTVQRKPRFFKIITIDDVTLWSKLESIWSVYSNLLILFHRRTIFKMLTLEQSAEKCPFSAWGGGSSDRSDPLDYGPDRAALENLRHYALNCNYIRLVSVCLSIRSSV